MNPKFLLLALVAAAPLVAEVKLASPFTSHMVLQREMPVPIWGKADAGEQVTVEFAGQKKSTTAGVDGAWRVELAPLSTSTESRVFSVSGSKTAQALRLQDVLVGEVWLGSGQSNMYFTMSRKLARPGKRPNTWAGVVNEDKEIAEANYPLIRMFYGEDQKAYEPKDSIGGQWEVCTPEVAPYWSAIGYYFSRALHRELKVPIGFVTLSYGASCAHAWIRREAMLDDPEFKAVLDTFDKQVGEFKPPTAEQLAEWQAAAAKAKAEKLPRPSALPRNPVDDQHNPTVMYNGMIAPFVGYALRGVVWYQGESITAPRELFPRWNELLIKDWRKLWNRDLPFYFVQLASQDKPSNSPEVREWQAEALKVPNTGMVVAIDMGEKTDVHPHNKEPIGERLARIALARDYGQRDLVYSGPMFVSATPEAGSLRLKFAHIGGGLVAKGGPLKTFEVAGKDGTYHPADAVIEGDTIAVRSAQVPDPVEVRYAWASFPEGANLFNAAGLPSPSFRSK